MAYRVRIDPLALREIERFAEYLRDYREDFAIEQFERLDRILRECSARSRHSRTVSPRSPARISLRSIRATTPALIQRPSEPRHRDQHRDQHQHREPDR